MKCAVQRRRHVVRALLAIMLTTGFLAAATTLSSPAEATARTSDTATVAAGDVVDVIAPPYLAKGDGKTNDRPAIQRAIDDVSAAGGGTVVLDAGRTFLSGDLVLKNGVALEIDGTLKQSQDAADYTQPPGLGHFAGCDLASYCNLPLIYARNTSDVQVTGTGTIQMTLAAGGLDKTIETAAIGFYRVSNYAIRHVHIEGGWVYNVMLYSTSHGTVDGITIQSPAANPDGSLDGNTDGISVQNSSDIRITQNTITTNDDAVYVWASYHDPRGGLCCWWSSATPEPSRNIRIDHDVLRTINNGNAFAIIPWGVNDPDQSQVEISDLEVDHNTLIGGTPYGSALACWCVDIFNDPNGWTGSHYGDQSDMTRLTITDNTYQGAIYPLLATDVHDTDFPMLGSGQSINGDFSSGTAGWTTEGNAGAASYESLPPQLDSDQVRTATPGFDGQFGYLVSAPSSGSSLYEGLGLGDSEPLDGLLDNAKYNVSVQIATSSGSAAQVFVEDTCTHKTIASQAVDAPTARLVHLSFTLAESCQDIEIGAKLSAGQSGWAVLDDFTVTPPATSALDPGNDYVGFWQWSSNATNEWRGSDMIGTGSSAVVTSTFSGTRARVIGELTPASGTTSFSVDGKPPVDVDLRAPSVQPNQVLFDTGQLPPGRHTIKMFPSGTSTTLVFNSLLVDAIPMSVNRNSLDFGSTPVGSTSSPKLIVVQNNANTSLSISNIALSGSDPQDFTADAAGADGCDGKVLNQGDACTVSITYAPTADGDGYPPTATGGRTGTLSVMSSTGDIQKVALSGTTPDSYNLLQSYSDLIDNKDSRLSRSGGWATFVSADGNDIGSDHIVGFGAGANATTTFTGTRILLWGTTANNLGTANVLIDGNSAGTANFFSPTGALHTVVFDSGTLPYGQHTFQLQTVTGLSDLDALLVYGGITTSASPQALSFGQVASGSSSGAQTVSVTATGAGAAKIGGVRIIGANSNDFQILPGGPDACTRGTVLDSGTSCSVQVVFSPSDAGERTAVLRIADTTDSGANTVPLTGDAVSG